MPKGAYKNVEGKKILLPAKGHLQDTLTEMEQDFAKVRFLMLEVVRLLILRHVDYVIVKKNSI